MVILRCYFLCPFVRVVAIVGFVCGVKEEEELVGKVGFINVDERVPIFCFALGLSCHVRWRWAQRYMQLRAW